jgi:hypothetical protein
MRPRASSAAGVSQIFPTAVLGVKRELYRGPESDDATQREACFHPHLTGDDKAHESAAFRWRESAMRLA